MKKYIIISLVLLSFLSCVKTLDFDDEGFANQVVLNSIFWPDSVFKVSVTKSLSILEDSYEPGEPVTDGTVDIYENDLLLVHHTLSTGAFRTDGIKPTAGNTYKAVVTSQGRQITAETTIPYQAEIVSSDSSSVIGEYGQKIFNYKIKIKDPEGEDFYRIGIITEFLEGQFYQNQGRYKKQSYPIPFSSSDPVFKSVYNNFGDETIETGPTNEYGIFPDDLLQGKEYTLQIRVASNNYHAIYSKVYYERHTIHVQRISKDLYNYLKYLELYNFYHDNPIAEPVPVYSNVKNGAGIFAGFNDDAKITFETNYLPYSMDTIKLEEEPNNGGYGGNGGY
jgi:hypothetical protein